MASQREHKSVITKPSMGFLKALAHLCIITLSLHSRTNKPTLSKTPYGGVRANEKSKTKYFKFLTIPPSRL